MPRPRSLLCYRHYMPIKTTIVLNDHADESVKACADAAGQTVTEWIDGAEW